MNNPPMHRSILALDIVSSTHALRTNLVRLELRRELYREVGIALKYAGVDEQSCEPLVDRGDGMLALIHPDGVPKAYLVSRLIPELTRQLVAFNADFRADELQRHGMRLRAAIHHGEVHRDANGYCGEAVDITCRLLDARGFKRAVGRNAAGRPMALVVSKDFYRNVVHHGYDGMDSEAFRPLVHVTVSGTRHTGYLHYPDPAPRAIGERGYGKSGP